MKVTGQSSTDVGVPLRTIAWGTVVRRPEKGSVLYLVTNPMDGSATRILVTLVTGLVKRCSSQDTLFIPLDATAHVQPGPPRTEESPNSAWGSIDGWRWPHTYGGYPFFGLPPNRPIIVTEVASMPKPTVCEARSVIYSGQQCCLPAAHAGFHQIKSGASFEIVALPKSPRKAVWHDLYPTNCDSQHFGCTCEFSYGHQGPHYCNGWRWL